ncbi:hypothetical protein JZ751_017339 [Albula glossodonta]|uniref:procollagen-proline 3-dioxygenase n=1 Tax=Albula glossodonta TaxID=121402 RepID=A0A8T2PHF3_9TELE|nr:hypothetical protein JZ751_017339 [Albula glossodonta]
MEVMDLHMVYIQEDFLEAKKLYSADSFAPAIERFEGAVTEYFTADQECRALCEGAYDYDGYNYLEYSADLFQSMTDHYMQVLNCKQNCAVELASLPGKDKPMEDFLPSHFNYLQFSYYNTENYEKAIECAKTYLLFHPEDEVMSQNLAFYSATLGEDKAAEISARELVQRHIKQSLLEKELLYFAYDAFGITFVDPDSWTPAEVMPQRLRDKQKADRETAARITEEIGNLMKEIETLVEEKNKDSNDITKIVREGGSVPFDDITVTMTSKSLNGSQRVVMDKVISDDECRELHRLSNAAALRGDGYRGKPSPHSPSEMFQGVTVFKALKLGQEGKVPLKSARLFFDLSEKVRKVLESYFRLETELYFSYTHLVCRSAIDEKQEGREDLSHPVHVDNCLLVSEHNECIKEPPAYTHRDYSAILYLNDDFEGGDFIFTELDAKTVTAEIRPQCGRVVGFGAGKENPHGVRAVTRGQRCAVALWFTLDPRHKEKERIQAEDLLKMLSSPLDAEFQKSLKDTDSKQPAQTSGQADQSAAAPDDQEASDADKQAQKEADTQAQLTDKQSTFKEDQLTDKESTGTNVNQLKEKETTQSTDKKADQSTDKKAEKSTDKKEVKQSSKQPAKQKQKATEKTGSKLKEKQADKKVKQADKTKVKEGDKKVKTSTKKTSSQKEKPLGKKAAVDKSSSDSGTGATATEEKSKSLESKRNSQDSKAEASSTADSQKDKDEL